MGTTGAGHGNLMGGGTWEGKERLLERDILHCRTDIVIGARHKGGEGALKGGQGKPKRHENGGRRRDTKNP